MVALRETHKASFDFDKWSEALVLPEHDKELLHKAHLFVMSKIGQKNQELSARHSHLSAEIVSILMSLNMDLESLEVAFLYPAFEDNLLNKEEVEENFGPGVAKLLMAVKDMEAIRFLQNLSQGKTSSDAKVDRVRRMLLAMVDDVRAVVIKLAERIAVIREAKHASEKVRMLIAREVSNIYAPLANRLGIGQLKWELEDLAFRFLHPQTYMQIAKDLGERRVVREQYIANFVAELKALLEKEGIKAEVYGRPKHIYSIWRKMQKKHLEFSELYDIRAVRVVVETMPECYAALGVIHTKWQHLAKEFDDYIANPKPNGYQSIHTVVYGAGGKAIEVQIRTQAMHQMAELGVAAHWKYKEGAGQVSGAEQRINFLRKLLAWRDDMVESGALLEEFRKQVFEDRVYVFTPQGEVIDLPTGSTPLDFAYHVHTMVGHRCIGAKVNGRIVPYTYKLKTGEQVEIITQKEPNPSRDWINADNGFLKTAKARSKVQAWFRKVDYERNFVEGSETVEKEVARHRLGINKDQLASLLKEKLSRFNVKTVDDVFAGVGAGDISINQVISYLQERLGKNEVQEKEPDIKSLVSSNTKNTQQLLQKRHSKSGIVVDGVGNMMTHIAKCCQPIPGDKIIGFITQGRGISIHRQDCPQAKNLMKTNPERVVNAQWGSATSQDGYTATLRVTAPDYPGLLRDVTTVIANEKLNVLGVRSRIDRMKDLSIIDVDLMLAGASSLSRVVEKLKAMPKVKSVKRL
ncbi:MAG: GTP diphosphokinase [Proteobacteria bacterium]|uniref:GTP pyrophosphokinase n=1 Tax=Candidatus Avisuccinivibrio stercorigallinarum TaxID=2840704 RepID=A0A9D9DAH4_9GAMM|nr:GTP diphosphokinase [Candidatus Avisuccinivibrio stercorigallinarum]